MNPASTKLTVWVALAVIVVHALLIAWALHAADRHKAPPGADQVVQQVQLLPARSDSTRKERPAVVGQRAGRSAGQVPTVAAPKRSKASPPATQAPKATVGAGAPLDAPPMSKATAPAVETSAALVVVPGASPVAALGGAADKGAGTGGGPVGTAVTAGAGQAGQVQLPDAFAKYLNNPDPPYPKASQQQREQGRVLLRVWVSAEGRAQKVELAQSSGHERLDASAQTAVAGWRFVPGRRNGQAEGMWALVPVVFKLN